MLFRTKKSEAELNDKIMDLVLKKNITFLEAKKIIESNQSSLTDFKIK